MDAAAAVVVREDAADLIIPKIWKLNPHLTFEQARYKASIKFGIYGFSGFVKERDKALNKKYWRLFRQNFKEYFTVPKIVLTLFLIGITYMFFEISPKKNTVLFGGLFVICVLSYLYSIYLAINRRINSRRTGKKWLFEEIFLGPTSIPFFLIVTGLPQIFYRILKEGNVALNWTFYYQILFATILVIFAITFYISLIIIPSKMKETIVEEYGTHKISSQ